MRRLIAMFLLGFLALGIAGVSASSAGAGPARCVPDATSILDNVEELAPTGYAEGPSARSRQAAPDEIQTACNASCARACGQRFGRCPTRECRQQFSACVRSCGC